MLRIVSEHGQERNFIIGSSTEVVKVGKAHHSDIIIVGNPRVARLEFQILIDRDNVANANSKGRFVAKDWAVKATETTINGSPMPLGGQHLEDGDVIQIPGLSFHFRTIRKGPAKGG